MASSTPLFEPDLPPGLLYCADFISEDEETQLLDAIANVTFAAFEMRGVVARRRVAFFGHAYDRSEAQPMPAFLLPIRERIGSWARIDATAFAMALINEYPPGAPIGWHRDAPQYDVVAGISLLSDCRMRFRRYRRSEGPRRVATHELLLPRRSAYLMTRESRTAYEHHIPPVTERRYSITFRTIRQSWRD